jgi:tRNA pseudouridine13 synthase
MEDLDSPSSPRKKLKLDSHRNSEFPSSSPQEPPATNGGIIPTMAAKSVDPASLQLHKEEDVGITEFVSPDLPGFSGILKKRFASTSWQISISDLF